MKGLNFYRKILLKFFFFISNAKILFEYMQATYFTFIMKLSQFFEKQIKFHQTELELCIFQTSSASGNMWINLDFSELNPKASTTLDHILFIGRLCKTVYSSKQLSSILNSSFEINEPKSSIYLARMLSARSKTQDTELFVKAKYLLRKPYLYSYALWSFWIVKEFSLLLGESVLTEDWNDPNRIKTWDSNLSFFSPLSIHFFFQKKFQL